MLILKIELSLNEILKDFIKISRSEYFKQCLFLLIGTSSFDSSEKHDTYCKYLLLQNIDEIGSVFKLRMRDLNYEVLLGKKKAFEITNSN